MISILSPINTIDEIYELKKAGAGEVYCGYVPDYWKDLFNKVLDDKEGSYQVGINKRDVSRANIADYSSLCKLLDLAEQMEIEVFVTLNAAFYPFQAYQVMDRYLEELSEVGVRNVIVSDIGMIKKKKTDHPELKLTVSCLSQVMNMYSVEFYRQFSPRRIVFPRHVTVDEIVKIVSRFPEIEFEFFLFSDKCIYDDGNCRCHHDIGTICMDVWNTDVYVSPYVSQSYRIDETDEEAFRRWTRNYGYVGGMEDRTFGNIGCSLCALPRLVLYKNINSIKIVGRGKATRIKVQLVELAAAALKLAENNASQNEMKAFIRERLPLNDGMCESNRYCIIR